jgi:hypothetical protein
MPTRRLAPAPRRAGIPAPTRLVTALTLAVALVAVPALAQSGPAKAAVPPAAPSAAAGETPYSPPTGPAPRMLNGKPDFSGVWEHPYVPDMASTNRRDPAIQKGPAALPYNAAGRKNIEDYNPERDGDYTGMCMPYGFVRSVNAPYPIQIMQSDKHVAFLFETNMWFTVVPFRDTHPELDPLWFGNSIAKWDGDTLVVETVGFNGFTRLDTKGNPHSDKMRLTQRFTRTDAGHLVYKVTVDDPVYYSEPWSNERTFTLSRGEIIEYSCMENNRGLFEGRIKVWTPPNTEPLRVPGGGEPLRTPAAK